MKKTSNLAALFIIVLSFTMGILLSDCGKSENKPVSGQPRPDTLLKYVDVVKTKTLLDKYWQTDYIKEFYKTRKYPPALDTNTSLVNKSVFDLWILKNELFARNGFLFDDAVLRAHFKQYDWYQPMWDISNFRVELTQQEYDFLQKVIKAEQELSKNRIVQRGENKLINYDHVLNRTQFANIQQNLADYLVNKNIAIVPAKHEQLFYVYEENQYQYVPNFITTDLYLQVLHKHLSSIMQDIEKKKFVGLLDNLLQELAQKTNTAANAAVDARLKSAAEWANTYLGIAKSVLTGKSYDVVARGKQDYKYELKQIEIDTGHGSNFLDSYLIDYSQFKPRGNYTDTEEMKRYFKCVKWLNTAPMYTDRDLSFIAAIMISYYINNSSTANDLYSQFSRTVKFLAGEEDNLSFNHIIMILNSDYKGKSLDQIATPENLKAIQRKLKAMDPSRINPKGGNKLAADEFARQYVLFTAGRYSFDAEIFINLVNIIRPEVKRPYPKGLDILAVTGNKTAEDILLKEYKEGEKWDGYVPELNKLKKEFGQKKDWNADIYNKTMESVISMQEKKAEYPLFMQTRFWDKKNMNTTLSAWTELKHDMILYSEQPLAAENGGGDDGPPPPIQISYVEPNINFWSKAIELLNLEEKFLGDNHLLIQKTKTINKELIDAAEYLLKISRKELNGEYLTNDEFNELSGFAGKIERLTFEILDTQDHLPDREKEIALITDVYTYNYNKLSEAVGKADEIYVIAEINGRPYITKGAVFSYYEFVSDKRYTDDEWKEMLNKGPEPKRPDWMYEIIVNTPPLKTKPEYSFSY